MFRNRSPGRTVTLLFLRSYFTTAYAQKYAERTHGHEDAWYTVFMHMSPGTTHSLFFRSSSTTACRSASALLYSAAAGSCCPPCCSWWWPCTHALNMQLPSPVMPYLAKRVGRCCCKGSALLLLVLSVGELRVMTSARSAWGRGRELGVGCLLRLG